MDEQASFAPQAVLGRRRSGWNRLVAVVPALALAAMVWTGISGARLGVDVAAATSGAAAARPIGVAPSDGDQPAGKPGYPPSGSLRYPAQVIGFDVQGLAHVQAQRLGRGKPIAIAGWYVTTAITDCPPLAAKYRPAVFPLARGHTDSWAYCDRSGVLYASRPAPDGRMPTDDLDNNTPAALGLPAVAVSLVVGVVLPEELEVIGADAMPVVVVGHFVSSGGGPWCGAPGCPDELVVDYLGWSSV